MGSKQVFSLRGWEEARKLGGGLQAYMHGIEKNDKTLPSMRSVEHIMIIMYHGISTHGGVLTLKRLLIALPYHPFDVPLRGPAKTWGTLKLRGMKVA